MSRHRPVLTVIHKVTYPCPHWNKKVLCDLDCSQTSFRLATFPCSGQSLCPLSLAGLHLGPHASQPAGGKDKFPVQLRNLFDREQTNITTVVHGGAMSPQCAYLFKSEFKLKVSMINTLITPWSLLGVTSMPFAANTAVADWPSIGRSWSVVISECGHHTQ